MIVVADTSPINYLILIEAIEVLPKLYGRAIVPQAVCDELVKPSAPDLVQAWVRNRPAWIEIRNPTHAAEIVGSDIDAGERDAILLAEELGADRLIIDDQEGRRAAERRGCPFQGLWACCVTRQGSDYWIFGKPSIACKRQTFALHQKSCLNC